MIRPGVDLAGRPVTEVAQHDLDVVARLPEEDGGHLGADEIGAEHDRLLHVARADAELGVHHRRVEEEEAPGPLGRAVVVDGGEVALGYSEEARGVSGRIADGRGGADQDGVRPVKGRDAEQATEHVRHVGAEHPLVRVELVDHDVAQVLERPRPRGVVRQHPGVQHVGVGDDDPPALARRAPRVGRRVAVIDHGGRGSACVPHQVAQSRLLIAGERLGRIKVDGAGVGLARQGLEHGEVEAEALAARRGGGDDEVPAASGRLEGSRLVGVELVDAAIAQGANEPRSEAVRKGDQARTTRGQRLVGGEVGADGAVGEPALDDGVDASGLGPGGARHGQGVFTPFPRVPPTFFRRGPNGRPVEPIDLPHAPLDLGDVLLAALHTRSQLVRGAQHSRHLANRARQVCDGGRRADLRLHDAPGQLLAHRVEALVGAVNTSAQLTKLRAVLAKLLADLPQDFDGHVRRLHDSSSFEYGTQ